MINLTTIIPSFPCGVDYSLGYETHTYENVDTDQKYKAVIAYYNLQGLTVGTDIDVDSVTASNTVIIHKEVIRDKEIPF